MGNGRCIAYDTLKCFTRSMKSLSYTATSPPTGCIYDSMAGAGVTKPRLVYDRLNPYGDIARTCRRNEIEFDENLGRSAV